MFKYKLNTTGSILITALIILTVLSFFCLFIFRQIINYSSTTKHFINNLKSDALQESAKNIGIVYIKNSINEILNEPKYIVQKEIKIKDNQFTLNVEWLEYPQKIKLTAGYLNSSKMSNSQDYLILIYSPFIYQISAFENLEISADLNSKNVITSYYGKTLKMQLTDTRNMIFFTPWKNVKTPENILRNSNIKYSLNEYNFELSELEHYSKIADIELEENYIANRTFAKNIIYKNGDLILRNCALDSCLLIVTGNLTIEENFSITGTDKYIFDTDQYFEIVPFKNLKTKTNESKQSIDFIPRNKYKVKLEKNTSAVKRSFSKISTLPAIICGDEIFMNLSSNKDIPENTANISGCIYGKNKLSIRNMNKNIKNIFFISNNIKIIGNYSSK